MEITVELLNKMAAKILKDANQPDTIIVSNAEYEELKEYEKTGIKGPILTARWEAVKKLLRGQSDE